MKLQYFLRKPEYPVLGNFEGHFISAKNKSEFRRKLAKISLKKDTKYNFLDYKAEGFCLDTKLNFISPMTMKKRWTKREIIALFNERENTELADGRLYSEKSLSSKRVNEIIFDLVLMG